MLVEDGLPTVQLETFEIMYCALVLGGEAVLGFWDGKEFAAYPDCEKCEPEAWMPIPSAEEIISWKP